MMRETVSASVEYTAACPCGSDGTWYVTLVALYDTGHKYGDKFIGFDTRYEIKCDSEGVLDGAA